MELGKVMIFRTTKVVEKARHNKALIDEALKLASMLRCYGARFAVETRGLAIDFLGGHSYIAEYDAKRWFRFAKQLEVEIVEETKEI